MLYTPMLKAVPNGNDMKPMAQEAVVRLVKLVESRNAKDLETA
jgi:hypothetical protein